MNNNRGSGRRRGRGSNRPSPGGRGNESQGNRIDNRARGNVAQLLEKYKKLAQDAQVNGDRVNTEYYLQFADHYFRVLADNKARQDDNRKQREDEPASSRDAEGQDDRSGGGDRGSKGERKPREAASHDRDAEGETSGKPRSEKARPSEAPQPRRRARNEQAETEGDALDASVLPPAIGGDPGPSGAARSKRAPSARRASKSDGKDNSEAAPIPAEG